MVNVKSFTEVANQLTNGGIDFLDLSNALKAYFFDGEGKIYCPWSEERPSKPGKKIKKMLEEAGFAFVSGSVTLRETSYIFTIMTEYGENETYTDVEIDYWNQEIYFRD